MKKLFILFLVLLIILSGCNKNTQKQDNSKKTNAPIITEYNKNTESPIIEETPVSTAVTPTSTETPMPTITPATAITSTPTATPNSTATPTEAVPTATPTEAVPTATPTEAVPTATPTITIKPTPIVKPTVKPTPTANPTAKPMPTAEPTPIPEEGNLVTSSMLQKIETEFLRLVNNERSRVGVNTLTINSHLDSCAITRSKEIIQSFSHTRPNGTSCFTLVDSNKYKYNALGENIVKTSHVGNGYITPFDGSDAQLEAVATHMFTLFKNSPGHYENMIKDNFEHCGIGISYEFDESAGIPAFYCAHLFGADFN